MINPQHWNRLGKLAHKDKTVSLEFYVELYRYKTAQYWLRDNKLGKPVNLLINPDIENRAINAIENWYRRS